YKSLLWVLIPMLLINGMIMIIDFPLKMPIGRWLIFTLLITHIYNFNRLKFNWGIFPLKSTIIFLVIGSLFIGVFDNRLSFFDKFYAPFRDMTDTYLILFLGYVTVSNEKDIIRLGKPVFYSMIFVGLYGLFNFVSNSNPYYEFVINNFFKGGESDFETRRKVLEGTAERYRATSTFDMSFNYGYISSLIVLYFVFLFSIIKQKKSLTIGIILGLIGVVLCFSRTVLLVCLFALFLYILLSFKAHRILLGIFTCSIILSIGYFSIPILQKSVDNVLDIFITGGESTGGSSVSMREAQTIGAFNYFLHSPIRGNGYDYITKELGWGDRDNAVLDSEMAGFESIIYVWLIEQGLIGILTKFSFFGVIIFYFLKNRNRQFNKKITGFGLALTAMFLLFSFSTGALGAWPITMLLLGVIIKTIQLNNRKYEILNSNTRI
ncbi:O-antigen ligase family protein, partial [Sphingobacterium rhinopitheci]|uniref:O-antigen ligase family protein n=1 Tax=Sphingobacterium rhinopitheci TaxID=2781960 RepID=UPI001F51B807